MAMKRRLLDCLQTSDQSLSRDTSNPLFKTQKISFKMFQQKETIHMKSLYPFLTKTQINSKVRQLWKNMSGADKKNFNKVVLTKTPTKSLDIAKQMHKKGNNAGKDMTRKNKCSIWKDFKQENEPKRYDGDFSSPEMIVKKDRSCPSWLMPSPSVPVVTKDFSKTRFQSDISPEVIDKTPGTQPGILKQTTNSDNIDCQFDESSMKKKNRVSFSPQRTKDISQSSVNINSSPLEDSQGYSSEEDINLIQRDTEDVCNFDEIDDFSMCIETDDPLVGNPPLKVKVEMEETIDRNNELNDEDKLKLMESEEKNKINQNEALKMKKKSPGKPVRGKKNVNNVSKNKTTPEITTGRITRSTPVVSKSNVVQYTPLMDDATMKELIEQAKKAPRKRQSRGGGGDTRLTTDGTENKTSEVSVYKKHVRTSLICPKTDDEDQEETMVDASGDAKVGGSRDKLPDSKNEIVQNQQLDNAMTDVSEELEFDDGESVDVDVQQYLTVGQFFRIPERPHDIELSDSESNDDGTFLACKSTSNNTVLEALKRMKEAAFTSNTPVNSPVMSPKILSPALSGISQLSSASSESKNSLSGSGSSQQLEDDIQKKDSDTVEQTKRGHNTKEKSDIPGTTEEDIGKGNIVQMTTDGERCVVLTENEENEQNNRVKSELLTDFWATDSMKVKDKKIYKSETKPAKCPKITRFAKRKTPTALHELGKGPDKALCELFFDMTPPEEKRTKNSSRRLLTSAVTPGNSNFNSLFENQSIF